MQIAEQEVIAPPARPRDPIFVGALNLVTAGIVGYFLLGQRMKAIVAILLSLIAVGLSICSLPLILAVAAAVDGYLQAQQQRDGHSLGPWTFLGEHI